MPKRPASLQSGNSSSDRPEPKLLRAVESNSIAEVKDVIEQAHSRGQFNTHFLSIGLVRACDKNHVDVARFLLSHGANPDYASGNKPPSLLRAAEYGLIDVARSLIEYEANLEARDKKGRTALMTAAFKGHYDFVQLLLAEGAHIDTVDLRRRNVLHNLGADKGDAKTATSTRPTRKCGMDIINCLLRAGANLEAEDELGRTPLHWTCVTDHEDLMRALLQSRVGGASPKARVEARDNREKTPLHLAAANNSEHLVRVLLSHGADVHACSDGGWTALHNASAQGSAGLVEALLDAGADVNSELLNGRTPLHVAAESGNRDAAGSLLKQPECRRAVKDRFGNTPLLLAAQHKKKDIAELLAPWNHLRDLSRDEVAASKQFQATIVDFGDFRNDNRVLRRPVYDVLYARDSRDRTKHTISTLPRHVKGSNFRWIHLPVNNIAWCDALLTKRFIEEGATDVEGYKALEMSFSHQHKGQQHHSRFMRPMCQVVHRTVPMVEEPKLVDKAGPPPLISEPHLLTVVPETNHSTSARPKSKESDQPTAGDAEAPTSPKQKGRTGKHVQRVNTMSSESSNTGKQSQNGAKPLVKRQETGSTLAPSDASAPSKVGRPNGSLSKSAPKSPRKQASRKDSRSSINQPVQASLQRATPRNLFMFMPYLHFETDRRRREMQLALENPETLRRLEFSAQADEVLIRAHLEKSSSFLHVRRTLDQFFYHNIDTRRRDTDQVVYRFQQKHRKDEDPKLFMVDQLWMWVLGQDLVVTSFPQRWRQPRNDPLNVLEGIIEDINSKTRDSVQNVYELAMTISARCFGTFDRHRKGDDDFQFMDMFEASIGAAMDGEATLFDDFSASSRQASEWLRTHQRPNRFSRNLEAETKARQHAVRKGDQFHFDEADEPQFIDRLLDVGAETDLLAEIKDIRDELDIIRMVLSHQEHLLPELRDAIKTVYRDERSLGQLRKLDTSFAEHEKTISNPLKDITRMDKQAYRIYESIRDLLDLKQKHANAFEARFARDQAAGTQRQGQTIMVFTIVTVIFLPLSFIAAFFAINIRSFPHDSATGQPSMSLGYVSRYVFGIGLAISIPCIAIALSVDELGFGITEVKRRARREWARWKWGRRSREGEVELQSFKIEQTLSVARSLRRSGEVVLAGRERSMGPSKRSEDEGRRMPASAWDLERGRRNVHTSVA